MNQRVIVGALIGCAGLAFLGLLLFGAVMCGATIGMQKAREGARTEADEGETTNTPRKSKDQSEKYIPVVLRVSGEQGTRYKCSHSNISDDEEVVFEEEEGTLGSRPVEYRARIMDTGISDPYSNFTASCGRNGSPTGRIKAEIIVNEQVVASEQTREDPPGQTSVKGQNVQVSWGPYTPKDKESTKGKAK